MVGVVGPSGVRYVWSGEGMQETVNEPKLYHRAVFAAVFGGHFHKLVGTVLLGVWPTVIASREVQEVVLSRSRFRNWVGNFRVC